MKATMDAPTLDCSTPSLPITLDDASWPTGALDAAAIRVAHNSENVDE
jgi:hypothetical protein